MGVFVVPNPVSPPASIIPPTIDLPHQKIAKLDIVLGLVFLSWHKLTVHRSLYYPYTIVCFIHSSAGGKDQSQP